MRTCSGMPRQDPSSGFSIGGYWQLGFFEADGPDRAAASVGYSNVFGGDQLADAGFGKKINFQFFLQEP